VPEIVHFTEIPVAIVFMDSTEFDDVIDRNDCRLFDTHDLTVDHLDRVRVKRHADKFVRVVHALAANVDPRFVAIMLCVLLFGKT
jgi:hypothetical protein